MDNDLMFSSSSKTWETPQELFDYLHNIFQFEIDIAADPETAKCEKWVGPGSTIALDAFDISWEGSVWLNPPYGEPEHPCKPNCTKQRCEKRGWHAREYIPGVGDWLQKAKEEGRDGTTIAVLLPARTETKWFQVCWQARFIVFLYGRLKFGGSSTPAPFPSCVAIFGDPDDLPDDIELTQLATLGTVVRPMWRYCPTKKPILCEKVVSVPYVGEPIEYTRATRPEDKGLLPEERIKWEG
jgi:phage N-6-adenine-methyltransferase